MREDVQANARWLQDRRTAAWAFGREHRDGLLRQYEGKYGLTGAPPALLVHELIPEFLRAKILFQPLPLDRFAQTGFVGGELCVTLNSDLPSIHGVRDAAGVENVALWHEAIHVIRDVGDLATSAPLPGFGPPPQVACYRALTSRPRLSAEAIEREFWAEEAGRAAAVSMAALRRTEPFREFMRAALLPGGAVSRGFPLLYAAAEAIGVNISALVKQLTLEGLIAVEGDGDRKFVYRQPALMDGGP
jgi:hypothetical protein